MMQCPFPHHRASRGTFGEALIAVAALAGFFYGLSQGNFSLRALWAYALVLLVIVAFYASLLICKMVFHWATSGDYPHGRPEWVQPPVWTEDTRPASMKKK